MLGSLLQTTATMNPTNERAFKSIFGFTEIQNRVATNTVKMIIGDMTTLYNEFRNVKGPGALFFNPANPDSSKYLTIADIRKDIILAEELMDGDLTKFLSKLVNVIEKEENAGEGYPIIVMVTEEGMTVHKIDLNAVERNLKTMANDASS